MAGPRASSPLPPSAQGTVAGRIRLFDIVRGVTIISMVAFHATYDLVFIFGVPIAWFTNDALQELWRVSISWVFIALAGWMTSLTRSNPRRAAVYAGAAVLVWAGTAIASVDTTISFGIIFCMAASTLLWSVLERTVGTPLDRHPIFLAAISITGFIALYDVPRGVYDVPHLAWLGFPGRGFSSGDYYPLIPFTLLYIAFALLARAWVRGKHVYPQWMRTVSCKPLEFIGRHSLLIYLAHQAVLMAVLTPIFGL